MDSNNSEKGRKRNTLQSETVSNGRSYRSESQVDSKSSTGPTFVLLWVWNWFTALPKTVTNLYADFKNGDLLARFTLLDAMLQFFVAVATSCHPQEEAEAEEYKSSPDSSPSGKTKREIKVFGGTGRTLRSRAVETNS